MTGAALRLLYVDDDGDIRAIVAMALALDSAIEPLIAESSAVALALIAGGARPDVAVLDVAMPDMDGPALRDALHRLVPAAGLPVIFMTAHGRPHELAALRAGGAIGVIVKPFDPLALATEIRALLNGS